MKTRLTILALAGALSSQAATIVWTNTAGGNWNTAANWSPNTVPNAADHVVIITNAGTYSVTNNSASRTIGGLVLGGAGGTQTLAQVASLTLTLHGAGSIGTNGRLYWASGTFTGTNVITVDGQVNWVAGTLGAGASAGSTVLLVSTNGQVNLAGASSKWFYGALTNDGVLAWADTGQFNQYGIVHNTTKGLIDAQTNAIMNASSASILVNEGILRKSGGTGFTDIEPGVVNSGSLEAQTGTLRWTGRSKAFNSGTRFTGAGTNLLVSLTTGQILSLDGVIQSENLQMASGSLTGTSSLSGAMGWASGELASGASLTVLEGSTLQILGSNTKNLRGALTNAGQVVWQDAGKIDLYGSIFNAATGVFEVRNDSYIDYLSGAPAFFNEGVFRKTAATGSTSVQVSFINNGTVDVQSGTLQLLQETKTFNQGCRFTGAGTVSLLSGAILLNGAFGSENLVLSGASLTGTGTLSGTMTWTSGNIAAGAALTVGPAGVLAADGSSAKVLYGALTNSGQVVWTGTGNLQFFTNSVVHNAVGGVFDARNDAYLDYLQGNLGFINDGTFRKSQGSGTTPIQIVFVNNGTVDAQVGTIQFFQETKTLNAGCRFTGGGRSTLTAGSINLAGTIESENLVLAGATLNGAGSVHGSFTWNSGTLSPDVSFNVTPTGRLFLASPTTKVINGTITNAGTVTWTGTGNLRVRGAIHNQSTGLFEIQNDEYLDWVSGNPVFVNDGIVRKTIATGNTYCQISFVNNGTVDIQTGVFQLLQEPKTLNAGCRFTGAGRTTLPGGSVTLNGAIESENLSLDGSTLAGAGSVNGSFTWNSGTLTPDISFNVTPSGLLLLASSGGKTLNGTITNAGTVRWTGTGNLVVRGAIHNLPGGLFDLQNDEVLDFTSGTPVIVNQGIFRKSAGIGITTCQIPFHNLSRVEVNSGTLSFSSTFTDHAGAIALDGGILQTAQPLGISGGQLTGRGTLRPGSGGAALLTSAATVAPATNGSLTIVGAYTQLLPGTLNLDLAGTAPGTNHSQLRITGDATLAGTIGVSLASGYLPSPGDTFNVMTYRNRAGEFACFNGFLFLGQNRRLLTQYAPTNLSLVAVAMLDPTNCAPRISAQPPAALICWPTEFTGWQLLSNTNLNTANWTAVPGATNRYLESPMAPEKYYRLRQP